MANLGSAVDELLAVDVRQLPNVVLEDEIVSIGRSINRLQAAYLVRLEVLDRRGAVASEHGSTAAWLRQQLRLAPGAASRDVHLARDLADTMPSVAAAMADGEVSDKHAQVLSMLRRDLGDDTLRAAEGSLADAARLTDPVELRRLVMSVRHSYSPESVVGDEKLSFDQRRLHVSTTLGGTGVGDWTCDPISHETIMTAIHAASAPSAGDCRHPAQRRLDALVTVCQIALDSGQLPETGTVKPHVSVVVTHETLRGERGAPAARLGFGGVTSGWMARRVSCDAEISRIVMGPSSEVLDAGRATRTFTAAQRRAIVARDGGCRWHEPCNAPVSWCEAHHAVHWIDGGVTSVENAVLLCGRHHDRLHRDNKAIIIASDGTRTVHPIPGSGAAKAIHDERAGPSPPAVRRRE